MIAIRPLFRSHFLPVLFWATALVSCTPHKPDQGVADLERYPQSASAYLLPASADQPLVDLQRQADLDAAWNKRFFAPWRLNKATIGKEAAFWGTSHFGTKQGYAENLQPIGSGEWQQLVSEQRIDSYPSMARPAISVRNTALRLLPSQRPFFLDPLKAGEGFPFDYFQSTALWAGTPLLATHVSANSAWYFVQAGFSYGWVPADAIAWTDKAFRRTYENGRYAALLHDNITLLDERGTFLTQTHLGAIFPVGESSGTTLQLLVPVRDADGTASVKKASLDSPHAALKPLLLTPQQIAALADTLIGQRYGWGGLYENRDCSATMRDLFTPFGLWLGRNSREQGLRGGALYRMEGMTAEEKRALIVSKGIPYFSLIWFKGHIGLYLGVDPTSMEPLLLHNMWGIHTIDKKKREGREIVGQMVVTSLHPGEERRDVTKNGFYERMLGLAVLGGESEPTPPATTAQ